MHAFSRELLFDPPWLSLCSFPELPWDVKHLLSFSCFLFPISRFFLLFPFSYFYLLFSLFSPFLFPSFFHFLFLSLVSFVFPFLVSISCFLPFFIFCFYLLFFHFLFLSLVFFLFPFLVSIFCFLPFSISCFLLLLSFCFSFFFSLFSFLLVLLSAFPFSTCCPFFFLLFLFFLFLPVSFCLSFSFSFRFAFLSFLFSFSFLFFLPSSLGGFCSSFLLCFFLHLFSALFLLIPAFLSVPSYSFSVSLLSIFRFSSVFFRFLPFVLLLLLGVPFSFFLAFPFCLSWVCPSSSFPIFLFWSTFAFYGFFPFSLSPFVLAAVPPTTSFLHPCLRLSRSSGFCSGFPWTFFFLTFPFSSPHAAN